MASFNQPIKETEAPNYLNYSKGTDTPKPNRAMETLFSGLANGIDLGVSAVDDMNKRNIQKDVNEGVDALRGAQGPNAALHSYPGTLWGTDQNPNATPPATGTGNGNPADIAQGIAGAGQPQGAPPPNADAVENRVGKLTSAFKNGTISDTYYYTQLEGLTRQLRSKYPGYREEIDQMIHRTTGITPANALRQSVVNDMATQQQAAQAQQNSDQKWIDSNREYLPADLEKRAAAGNPYNVNELKWYAGQQKIQEHTISTNKNALELAKLQGTLTKEQASSTLTNHLNTVFNDTLIKGAEAGGLGDFMKKVQDLQSSGKPLSPEDAQALRAQFGQLKLAYQSKMEGIINQTNASTGNSYASLINDNTELDKVRKNSMTRFDNIEQALTNGDFGLLNMNVQIAKAQQDEMTAKLMGDPQIRLLDGLSKVNQQLPAMFLNAKPEWQGQLVDGLLKKFALDRSNGTGQSFEKQLDGLKLSGKAGPKDFETHLRGAANGITDPGLDDRARVNVARSIFVNTDGSLLSKFDAAGQKRAFAILADPKVSGEIERLGKHDPELMKAYTGWVVKNFPTVMKGTLDTLAQSSNNPAVHIEFDPKVGQFVTSWAPGANLPPSILKQGTQGQRQYINTGAIDDLNKMLTVVAPVIKMNGGDLGTEVKTFLQSAPQMNDHSDIRNGVTSTLKSVIDAIPSANAGEKGGTLNEGQKSNIDAMQKQPGKPAGAPATLPGTPGKQSSLEGDPEVTGSIQKASLNGDDAVAHVVNTIVGNPSVEGYGKNPRSSAVGVGQFIDSTWLKEVKRQFPDVAGGLDDKQILALKRNPEFASKITEGFTRQNAEILQQKGLDVTPGNLYLMHFAGSGDAPKILRAPDDMPVERVMSAASIQANPFLAGMSVGDLKQWAEAKIMSKGGKANKTYANGAPPAHGDTPGTEELPVLLGGSPDIPEDSSLDAPSRYGLPAPSDTGGGESKRASQADELIANVNRKGSDVDQAALQAKHAKTLQLLVQLVQEGKIPKEKIAEAYKSLMAQEDAKA